MNINHPQNDLNCLPNACRPLQSRSFAEGLPITFCYFGNPSGWKWAELCHRARSACIRHVFAEWHTKGCGIHAETYPKPPDATRKNAERSGIGSRMCPDRAEGLRQHCGTCRSVAEALPIECRNVADSRVGVYKRCRITILFSLASGTNQHRSLV